MTVARAPTSVFSLSFTVRFPTVSGNGSILLAFHWPPGGPAAVAVDMEFKQ
jgi:hypothetical protein